jgi:hypothetical protein
MILKMASRWTIKNDDERIERAGDSVDTPYRNLWNRGFEDLRSQDVHY